MCEQQQELAVFAFKYNVKDDVAPLKRKSNETKFGLLGAVFIGWFGLVWVNLQSMQLGVTF